MAERYGWINRALPDDELDDFVENLALRISTFDRTALGDAKRLLNRDSLPDNSRLQEAQDAFFEATQRPQVALIGKKAVLTAATVGRTNSSPASGITRPSSRYLIVLIRIFWIASLGWPESRFPTIQFLSRKVKAREVASHISGYRDTVKLTLLCCA